MAAKKTNGHEPSTERMIAVLERIEKRTEEAVQALGIGFAALRKDLQAVRAELHDFKDETRSELVALNGEVAAIRNEVTGMRAEVGADLERMVGENYAARDAIQELRQALAEQGARTARLEEAVFKKTG
jgi:prophage DNA circulation protein